MRIAFINKYQGKVERGAETFIKELASRLSKNHEVDVLNGLGFKKKYDLVIPTNGRFQVVIARKISWLMGAKMVVSGQSGAGFDDRLNLYTFPDAFVALSEHQLNWARRINPFVRVVKIPNGVDLSKFKPSLKKNNKLKTILSVGAFTSEKRHDLTIKAVAKLNDAKLTIVGGGGDKMTEIKALGENVLGDRFEISSLANEKMPEIYRNADVFAFPSVSWESFGIACLEAMASGLPVVANNDPIRKEIVGQAGLFIDPTDTDSYTSALASALNTNWGDKPRRQAEKFDWDKIAFGYEKLFQTLVGMR